MPLTLEVQGSLTTWSETNPRSREPNLYRGVEMDYTHRQRVYTFNPCNFPLSAGITIFKLAPAFHKIEAVWHGFKMTYGHVCSKVRRMWS